MPSVRVHALVAVHRLIQPRHLLRRDDLGTVLFVARLEAQDAGAAVGAGFEEDALERGVAVGETDEAVVAVFRRCRGTEDDDVAFAVFRGHAVAVHACGEGVAVGDIRAADILVGHASGIIHVGEIPWITGGDLVDNRYSVGGNLLDVARVLVHEFLKHAGKVGVVEVDRGWRIENRGLRSGILHPRSSILDLRSIRDELLQHRPHIAGRAMQMGLGDELAGGEAEGLLEAAELFVAGRIGNSAGLD